MTEAEANVAKEVILSQWMGLGGEVDAFEGAFSEALGLDNFVMVDSGSNALFMAVKLLNLPAGSEVIVPSFTWVSCAQAVLMAGCQPVFCDVDAESMNVTAETVSVKITPRTRAIMVVHYAGLAVEMEDILALGLPVIEDAAHAVDSTWEGQACGGIGAVGIYSFDSVKNLAVGEGGGITTTLGSEISERARQLRYCGIGKSGFQAASSSGKKRTRWWEYEISEPFIKMLPTNISAAIGRVQLDRLPSLQARRKEIWDYYQSQFESVSNILRPTEANQGDRHSYFTYAIRATNRDEFASFMLDNGVYTTLRYHPLHLNGLYGQLDAKLPVSEALNETALSLPLHPRMSDSEVDKVVTLTTQFFSK